MPRSPMRPAHAVFALSLLTYICPSALSPTAPLTPLTPASARCPLRLKTDATAPARVKPSRAAALRMRGGSSALNDAELYLESVGVPPGLPRLSVTYTSETGTVPVQGGTEEGDFDWSDFWLQRQPEVKWDETLGKCTLLMLDPDAPDRKGDGRGPGLLGPWLHWIVTEAQTRPEKGVTMVEYMGPAPPAGTHRYIFILFQQSDPDAEVPPHTVDYSVAVPSRERRRWNFPEFLQANRGLVPVERRDLDHLQHGRQFAPPLRRAIILADKACGRGLVPVAMQYYHCAAN